MQKRGTWLRAGLTGAAAGAVNGLFGAGGGMLLLPLLHRLTDLREHEAFACSVCENMASWSSALIMCAASCFAITSFRYESSICCRVIFLNLLSKANINSPMNLWV